MQTQTYTLEAYASGRHRIPPLRLEMIDARAGSAADAKRKPQELLTEEIPLEIAPVPAAAADADLKPPRGALEPRVGGASTLVVLGAVSLALVLISGGLLMLRAVRAGRRTQQQRSAYDEAVPALRALEARGAPDAEAADASFSRDRAWASRRRPRTRPR